MNDIEKKLIEYPETLEVRADAGDAGRREMLQNLSKPVNKKRHRLVKIFAVCAACLAVLVTAIVVPIVLSKNKFYTEADINERFSETIAEYNSINNTSFLDTSCFSTAITSSQGIITEDNVDKIYYIKEQCSLSIDKKSTLSFYAIVNNFKTNYFSKYYKGNIINIQETDFCYNLSIAGDDKEYKGNFKYKDVQYFIYILAKEEIDLEKIITSILDNAPYYSFQDIITTGHINIKEFNAQNGTNYLNLIAFSKDIIGSKAVIKDSEETIYISDNTIIESYDPPGFIQLELMVKISQKSFDIFSDYDKINDFKIIEGIKVYYKEVLIASRYKTTVKFDFEGNTYYLRIFSSIENCLSRIMPILFS